MIRTATLATAIALAPSPAARAAPVPNALRFQVFVTQSGQPFNGSIDVQLQFFDAPSGGSASTAPITIEDVAVSAGLATITGDFGASNPMRSEDTYIGGGIRSGASTGAFSPFTKRGRFFPGGFALHAQKIAPGIVGIAEIQPGQVQRRIATSCALAEAIRQVNQDGSVVCEAVSGNAGNITAVSAGTGLSGGGSSGSVTLGVAPLGIDTPLLADDAVTAAKLASASVDSSAIVDGDVQAADLGSDSVGSSHVVDGSLGSADVDIAQVQRRVSGACVIGAAVRAVNADGSVECETIPNGAGDTWQIAGNAIAPGAFLGTTNDFPLDLRAHGERGLRLAALDDPDGNAYGGAISTMTVAAGSASNEATAPGATVAGGGNAQAGNQAHGRYSTVTGGLSNVASGDFGTAGGHLAQAGGDYSFAAGRRATVRSDFQAGDGDQGTFAWADAQDQALVSSGDNQFLVRAQGGVWFGTASAAPVSFAPGEFIATSTGAHLTTGGTWTNASSRTLKEGFAAIDPVQVLGTLLELPITTWSYRGSDEGTHLGPVAEDFKAAFGLGGDGRSIATVDADGVALAAIQGLNAKLEAEIAALRAEVRALREK